MNGHQAALITGAGKRVGRAIALHLAGEGWDIGIHYNTSKEDARAVAGEIEKLGRRSAIYAADLRREESCAPLVEAFCKDFNNASLLVNNASTYFHDTLETLKVDVWNEQLAVNTLAPILLARAFHSAAPGKACVVNFLDQKVVSLSPDYFTYTISKAALHAATTMLAMAFAPKTRVNGIAPGLLLPSGALTPSQFDKLHTKAPLGRGAHLEEICDAVSFIARAGSMTGNTIILDGGRHLERRIGEDDLPEA